MIRTLLQKTVGVIILVQGMLWVAVAVDPSYVLSNTANTLVHKLGYSSTEVFPWWILQGSAGILMILLAIFVLFPFGRRKKNIRFRGEHGEVTLALGPVQKTLTRVISTLPEVRRIHVSVMPDTEGRRIEVMADVVLQNCAENGVRRTSNLVSDCIAEAVSRSLGLEGLVNVQLNVSGIYVDARTAARRLRDEIDQRVDPADQRLSAVLARPPISAVTLETTPTPEPVKPVRPVPLAVEKNGENKSAAQLDEESLRLESEISRLSESSLGNEGTEK